jgi:hypothetical protein
MLVSDLIKELQTIEINHDSVRFQDGKDILGPAEVVIDSWDDGTYLGITGDIVFDDYEGLYLLRWPGW